MTCVVATRHKLFGSLENPLKVPLDGVMLTADSAGSNDQTILSYDQPKKVFKAGDFLIGYTTSFRMGQILQYCGLETLHAEPDEESFAPEALAPATRPRISPIFNIYSLTRSLDIPRPGTPIPFNNASAGLLGVYTRG